MTTSWALPLGRPPLKGTGDLAMCVEDQAVPTSVFADKCAAAMF